MSLKIANVEFDKYGAILMVNGKTGARRVMMVASAPALANWLSNHPGRNDSPSPVWIGIGTVGRYKPLQYESVRGLYRRLAKRAGLKKRVYTHLFRHTRATELANVFTEAQMKEHLGWVQDSRMPSTYVHLSGRDIDAALLRIHGILKEEPKAKAILSQSTCPRCGQTASSDQAYCPHCGIALNLDAALSVDKKLEKIDEVMNRLIQDPEFRTFLEKKIGQIYSSSQVSRKC